MPASPVESAPVAEEPVRAAIFRADGSRFSSTAKVAVEQVNFHNPTLLAEAELRRLRSVHDEFMRALTSRLSSLLRSEIALNLGKFETQPCETFIESLNSPTQIALFRVTPLNGVGFIEISPQLAAALTTRILGGREPTVSSDGYLTEIEIALLEDVIAIITSEWCEQWQSETPLNAHLIGHETNPRFIQANAKGAMMLVVEVEVALGRCEEIIQIAVPLSMIEPMMKRLEAARERESQRIEGTAAWRSNYDDIAIPVHAEVLAPQITIGDLLKLKVGDVIELPASVLESTQISVAGSVRFFAKAGQQNGFVAVEIGDKVSTSRI
jgi:flagellar motor switch protein FliM